MQPRTNESLGRRMTLADFAAPDVESVLRSSGETLATVQQMELDYLAAEKRGDDLARKKLNTRLQPIYQKLASLYPSRVSEDQE